MGRKTFRKKITSDELMEQINKKNIKLMERTLKEKNTRCSDKTVLNYRSDLIIFFTWNLLENDNKYFPDIKKIEFADFFSYAVDELKWGSSRFARVRSALSQISDFIVKFYDEEFPTYRNLILSAIELMPKSERRKKTVLSEEQVDSLFKYLSEDLKNPQEALLLAVYVSSGVRFSEALEFKTTIIDETNLAFNDIFIETTEKIKTKGRTKEGKLLHKYIIKNIFMEYYKDWLIMREEIMKKNNQEHDFVFIKQDGSPAKESTLRAWIRKWDNFLEDPFYPHCLRHYTVTYLTRAGLDSDLIIELMGWSASAGGQMYAIYNDMSAKERQWKGLDKLENALKK